jgi:hypothetical protein
MFSLILTAAATIAQAPSGSSTQAAFDAATKAWEEGRCAEAVPAFDRLANGPAAKRNATLAAAIAVRRALCLATMGRFEEAETGIRAGVETLAGQGEGFATEVQGAYRQLAQLAYLRLDYGAGIAAANRSLSYAKGADRIPSLTLLATLTRFDGDGAAIRAATEALQLTKARTDATKADIAAAQVSAARALLAAGRIDEADALLKSALANNGGLTTRTSLADVATRYDLAQVALLKKRLDDARLYLAYTGAGRQSDAPFARATSIEVPSCDEVPGMTPDSYAVVELALADDGSVARAEPIYAQGGREVALAFARAVRGWSWTPEAAQAIPAFYRMITRVELRCTNSAARTGLNLPLAAATAAWLEERGVSSPIEGERDADLIAGWRAAAAGNDAAALAANLQLADSSLGLAAERTAAAARAVAVATALGAPQVVRTQAALAVVEREGEAARAGANGDDWRRTVARRDAALRALLARPEVAAEPIGAATLRLRIADLPRRDRKRQPGDAAALLAAVAEAKDLPDGHPLKVHALLSQANIAAGGGDLAAAAAAFARTGLSEQQCALIGPTPTVASSGASASLYPTELVRMGFEGWARIEFDIAADGRTAAQRTVIAYPPFLFGDAAKAMLGRTRYVRSYRPEASVACAANQQSFRFVLPR